MITKTWMMLAIGLGLSATMAEASPFIINTASSSGGRSRRGSGGGGGGFGGGGGSSSSRASRTPGQMAMPTPGARGAATEGLAPLQSQGPAPNTSPFGSSKTDISAIVSTAAFGGAAPSAAAPLLPTSSAPATYAAPSSSTPNTVAFLDLGGNEFLAVTPPVVGGLVGQTSPAIAPNQGAGLSESATDDVKNPNVSSGRDGTAGSGAGGSGSAGGDSNGPGLDAGTVGNVLPVVGTGLVTYPTDVLTSLATTSGLGAAAIANPEPASLVLLGTGLALAARRKLRRKRA